MKPEDDSPRRNQALKGAGTPNRLLSIFVSMRLLASGLIRHRRPRGISSNVVALAAAFFDMDRPMRAMTCSIGCLPITWEASRAARTEVHG